MVNWHWSKTTTGQIHEANDPWSVYFSVQNNLKIEPVKPDPRYQRVSEAKMICILNDFLYVLFFHHLKCKPSGHFGSKVKHTIKVMLTFEGNMACSSFKVKKAEYTFSFPTAARTPNFNFIHFFTFSTSSRFAAIFLIQKKKFWLGNF